MAHIGDRWHKTVRGPDGRQRKERTARYGQGLRWQARYLDPDGDERGKSFGRRADAEQFLAMREKLRVRSELLASDGDGIDPCGWYVYLPWEVRDDEKPVYVGSSGNILARLRAHLGSSKRRSRVGWMTLIRCTSEKAMLAREGALIRKNRPEWNMHIPLENGRNAIITYDRPPPVLGEQRGPDGIQVDQEAHPR